MKRRPARRLIENVNDKKLVMPRRRKNDLV
jgi:hypothetical protein